MSLIIHFNADDYAVLQSISGEKFIFYFQDTDTYYPGTKAPAFPYGEEHIICWRTLDGKVKWQNSSPWMKDKCSKIEELESADYSNGTLITVLGNAYHTAPWINKEAVDRIMDGFKPHTSSYCTDLKIVNNIVVSYYTNYFNDNKDYERRVKLYKKLGKELY